MLLVFGVIDVGRALNAQITLAEAAREGARLAATDQPDVVARTQAAAVGLANVSVSVTFCQPGAGPAADAEVRVSSPFSFVTPIAALLGGSSAGSSITLTARAVMPCET